MKLPNGNRAIVDIRKLQGYCLNPLHSRGRNKARVFASVGILLSDAEELRMRLMQAASTSEAQPGIATPHGQRLCGRFRSHLPESSREDPQHLDSEGWRGVAAVDELLCTIREGPCMGEIELLSVVAVVEDLPENGLVRGQVGTVVESWAPGVYEVEFSDDNGRTYAMVALKAGQLMRLYHEPVNRAA